ncbi:hypothetical protein MJO28_012053 [Puccinia striiformis f. sp. tritici]|uniref:Uncharacterized protein n=1 Tax=Puccinia striiformis f. sp. tritici TaxID=168172 RepID=A0ACC0E020_9BASI|nr:hypothetical protein MJO28_012053 [Puccinia striiformis f. sp. tritici]KAI7946058.1 hypothetical protein MJO29_012446 [Puccinia striiformis f. sp. tritici]
MTTIESVSRTDRKSSPPFLESGDASVDYVTAVIQGTRAAVKFMAGKSSSEFTPLSPHVYNYDFILKKKIQIFNQHAMVLTQTLNYKSISHGKIADVILFGNPHFRAGPTQIFFWSGAGMSVSPNYHFLTFVEHLDIKFS